MTRAETVRCPKCLTVFAVECDHEADVGYHSLSEDETGICPTCGHAYGQALPAWRKSWDYEDAQGIEAEAVRQGLDPATLTAEKAAELAFVVEASA